MAKQWNKNQRPPVNHNDCENVRPTIENGRRRRSFESNGEGRWGDGTSCGGGGGNKPLKGQPGNLDGSARGGVECERGSGYISMCDRLWIACDGGNSSRVDAFGMRGGGATFLRGTSSECVRLGLVDVGILGGLNYMYSLCIV